jgi:hypothetical protein
VKYFSVPSNPVALASKERKSRKTKCPAKINLNLAGHWCPF